MYKVALVQCVCPHYRVPFFKKLAQKFGVCLFYGKGEKRGSWQNAATITGFKHRKLFSLKLKFKVNNITVRLVWFPALFHRLKKHTPDVVISEGFTNIFNNIGICLFCSLCSIPWIIWDSGRKKENPMNLWRKAAELLNIFLLKRAKAVLAYGSVARDYFLSIGINAGKIFVAHNTIDVESCMKHALGLNADPTPVSRIRDRMNLNGKKVILYVGALEKRKKVQHLITAFKEIMQEIPEAVLLIVGDGNYEKKLAEMVRMANIKNCIFTGKITEGVERFFALADFFVLPGQGGLAVNQAMSYGKPVIVGQSDGTEIDLVKHGYNGYLIKDINDLTTAMRTLLTNPLLRGQMGGASLEIIRRYTLKNMIQKFESAVEYVLSLS
jgi:glycosyltransferase involved in cell wall biosynthesis